MPAFVNASLLRSQQHQLAAIKACRQLFRHQRILRKVLKQPSVDTVLTLEALNEGEDVESNLEQLLIQRMMLKATQPSPLKAIFSREELEVGSSICLKSFFSIHCILVKLKKLNKILDLGCCA